MPHCLHRLRLWSCQDSILRCCYCYCSSCSLVGLGMEHRASYVLARCSALSSGLVRHSVPKRNKNTLKENRLILLKAECSADIRLCLIRVPHHPAWPSKVSCLSNSPFTNGRTKALKTCPRLCSWTVPKQNSNHSSYFRNLLSATKLYTVNRLMHHKISCIPLRSGSNRRRGGL